MNLYNLIKLAALIATVAGALFASPSGLSPDKAGATEILGEETDLGNGVVVQAYGFLEPDGQSTWPRNVRVVRDGCVIYDRPLCSGAEYYKIEDLNGNGSLDFRYGYGRQGTGNVEYSEIIDPLFHTMFRLDCETFKDLDGDGSLEAIARDHGIAYRWNYGVDEIDVRVVRKWSPSGEYWLPLGWEIDQEACYKPPPTEEGFQNLIREMRSCLSTLHPNVINTWADDMYDSNGSYLGCIAPKMVELCYTGHPNLAFTLLDESWPGTTKDKVAFEQEFIEELRNAEYVEVTTKFGLFDIAGRRQLQQEETLAADANFRDGDGDTPLILAICHNKNPQVYTLLIQAGADVNERNMYGITPLMLAVQYAQIPEVISELIKAGAEVNARDDRGITPLTFATTHPMPEVISILIKAGAEVNAKDKDGITTLMSAAHYSQVPEVISVLIKAGAEVNARCNYGDTPLMSAAMNQNPEFCTLLIKEGAKVKAKDDYGRTSLIFAAIHSMPEVISVLIEAGADVNAKDKDGITPLMWAAWYNDIPEVISVLIKAGAKVNARVPLFKDSVDVPESTKEKEGWSPLMFAASNNRNPEVISVLIKAGAEVNARDKTGRKAIDYAKSNFHLKDTDVYRQLHDASFE